MLLAFVRQYEGPQKRPVNMANFLFEKVRLFVSMCAYVCELSNVRMLIYSYFHYKNGEHEGL